MSTQQEAQERYEKVRKQQTGSMWFAQKSLEDGLDWREHIAEYFFTQGEASGERITLERLAAKSAEGFDNWSREYREGIKKLPYKTRLESWDQGGETHASFSWQAGRTPLLAKIELQDKRIAELEAENTNQHVIVKHHQGNAQAHLNGTSKLERRIKALEAQNKKLGDVVLELHEVLGEPEDDCPCAKCKLFSKHTDLIKQLKQEREL